MNELVKELRENFSNRSVGFRKIINYNKDIYSYTDSISFGIMLICDNNIIINEEIGKMQLYNKGTYINGEYVNCVYVLCNDISSRDMYIDFINDNLDNSYDLLKNNPFEWWKKWCNFLGNSFIEKMVYDLVGELYVLEKVYRMDNETKWASTKSGSIDIENISSVYEVKSTIQKYQSKITISSQQQLKKVDNKVVNLVLVRLEESINGKCIDDYVCELVQLGYSESELEKYLEKCSFPKNNHGRMEKYKVLEARLYNVDDNFPSITNESFKHNTIPKGIVKITYEIDLNSISYKDFYNEKN